MSAELLNGSRLAQRVRSQIRRKIQRNLRSLPGLRLFKLAHDPASTLYIKHKQRDCEKVHFHSEVHRLPADITQESLIQQIETLKYPIGYPRDVGPNAAAGCI